MRTLEELRCAVASDEAFGVVSVRTPRAVCDLIAHVQQQAEQIATLTARVAALEARADARDEIDEVDAEAMLDAKDWPAPAAPSAKLDEAPLGVGAKVLVPGEVVRVDDGDCTSLVKLRSIGDQHVLWFLQQDLRPEPASTSLTCVLCRSVEPQEGRVHTIRRHGKGHTSCDCAPAAPPPPAAPAPASDDYEARARAWLLSSATTPTLAGLLRIVADEATAKAAEKARREERAACEAVCRDIARSMARDGLWQKERAADECADRIAARGKDAASRACATGGGT